jgi:hypothetical protein
MVDTYILIIKSILFNNFIVGVEQPQYFPMIVNNQTLLDEYKNQLKTYNDCMGNKNSGN